MDEFTTEFNKTFGEIIDEGTEESYVKEFKAHAQFKAIDEETRIIEGFASTRFEDRQEEIIVPRAYRSSLAAFKKDGVILAYHDSHTPVGTPLDAKIVESGLWLKAQIGEMTQATEEAWQNIKQKMIKAFSVGFRTLKAKWIDAKDNTSDDGKRRIRMITDLELYEVSIVTIPANRQSVFSIAKGLNSPLKDDLIHIDVVTDPDGIIDYSETTAAIQRIGEDIAMRQVIADVNDINNKIGG